MRVYFSEEHKLHCPKMEIYCGEVVAPFESPNRVEYVLQQLQAQGLRDIHAPNSLDMGIVNKVHTADYLMFLETAWAQWTAAGFGGEILPSTYVHRDMRPRNVPIAIDGKVGYYAFASETNMVAGTWQAAQSSAAAAQSAAKYVAAGAHSAFALCRPPGHHAAQALYGGYCFLNNAAIAVETLIAHGACRVALLDIDFHHGNGSQQIFYQRGDVFFASLHGHPDHAFPYFTGYTEETGRGDGQDTTANYPLPPATDYKIWSVALENALARIQKFGADALVISLGVDAFKHDPISFFTLESADFAACGRSIATSGLPTVFAMEGGYAVDEVGVNVVNVLEGFLEGFCE